MAALRAPHPAITAGLQCPLARQARPGGETYADGMPGDPWRAQQQAPGRRGDMGRAPGAALTTKRDGGLACHLRGRPPVMHIS